VRKLSYIFLVLGVLTPFIVSWKLEQERLDYVARFGEQPEGMALFALYVAGTLCMLVLFAGSTLFAIGSYRSLSVPRPTGRKVELALLCLPLFVIVAGCVAFVAMPKESPPVIQIR
jgi:hypothetical protein